MKNNIAVAESGLRSHRPIKEFAYWRFPARRTHGRLKRRGRLSRPGIPWDSADTATSPACDELAQVPDLTHQTECFINLRDLFHIVTTKPLAVSPPLPPKTILIGLVSVWSRTIQT